MARIYLDYASTTPVDPRVRTAMQPYFYEVFGNPGSSHSFGQEASRAVFLARREFAEAIGADYREIIFTGSATEANNLALRGVVKAISDTNKSRMHANDANKFSRHSHGLALSSRRLRIIISAIEHESILETARDLEKDGVEVIYLPVSREGFVDLKKLKESLNERTVLVSVMYANNEIGSIQPIAKIAEIIKEFSDTNESRMHANDAKHIKGTHEFSHNSHGLALSSRRLPLFHTDAVQALQYLDCRVKNLEADPVRSPSHPSRDGIPLSGITSNGVDLMTLSAHKIYGPKGIGALYVRNLGKATSDKEKNRKSILHVPFSMSPIITGGGQEWNRRSGTENVPDIIGFAKAVELAVKLRLKEANRISRLASYFLEGIKKMIPNAELNGPALSKRRLPNNINVFFPDIIGRELLIKLDLAGMAVSSGSACSSRAGKPSHVLQALGLSLKRTQNSLRFTLGRPTTKKEIDTALKIMKNIIR